MRTYVRSPLLKVSRLESDARVVIHSGSGDQRSHLAIDGNGHRIVQWLLCCHQPATASNLAASLKEKALVGEEAAGQLVEGLISAGVLVAAVDAPRYEHIATWGRYGWRDAADFHLATYGLRFVPDEVDGVSYADYFAEMVNDTDTFGEQPPPQAPLDGELMSEAPGEFELSATLDDVLGDAKPINRFTGPDVTFAEVMPPLRQAFGVQRTVGGMLGPHHLRSYPSGGARHPFEAYVVSKGFDGLAAGVYHFDAVSGALAGVPDGGDPHQIDPACFGKGGILTARAVVVLTCRWLRHSWKYRYARSYRMLMLEVGHIVQAINLAAIGNGLNVYHCPSINDRELRRILALDDDCAEGPVFALGLGHGGVR